MPSFIDLLRRAYQRPSVSIVNSQDISADILKAWRSSVNRWGGLRSVYQTPEWAEFRSSQQPTQLAIYRQAGTSTVTPLWLDTLGLRTGGADRLLKGFVNSGSAFLLPNSFSEYRTFLHSFFQKEESEFLRVVVPHDDCFFKFLMETRSDRRWFLYVPQQHDYYYHWIDMAGGADAYWSAFKKKQRYNLERELKLLQERGRVECIRISTREQVPLFVSEAYRLGHQSWQRQVAGQNVEGASPDLIHKLVDRMCSYGILRSYLLKLNDEFIGFWTAFQQNGIFWFYDTGYDPAYSGLSPGKCMLQLILRDLFASDRPDYGSFGVQPDPYRYKSWFSTHYSHRVELVAVRNTLQNRQDVESHIALDGLNHIEDSGVRTYDPSYSRSKDVP
jgi:CelD/BcsL family acetyltransferase involved in cellulose biosynthesis